MDERIPRWTDARALLALLVATLGVAACTIDFDASLLRTRDASRSEDAADARDADLDGGLDAPEVSRDAPLTDDGRGDGEAGATTCAARRGDCNGSSADGCETPLDTTANCGACGVSCAFMHAAANCAAGACALGDCATGYANCDGIASNGCESNTRTDPMNCGACGTACSFPGATATCVAGACRASTCEPSRGDCDGASTNGCETDLMTSAANCAACGNACAYARATALCVGGACRMGACAAGFADCNANPADGCETDLASDPASCGACGRSCALPNATATCAAGVCRVGVCAAGFADCDATATNGCETATTTATDCGACGRACAFPNAAATCTAGVCNLGACGAGYADCDGAAANGCETRLNTTASCGACGRACSLANATPVCVSGACAVGACSAGFADCDGAAANGCETSLTTTSNCGRCGGVRLRQRQRGLRRRACALGACAANFADCDANPTDGCEANTQSNALHCAACSNVLDGGRLRRVRGQARAGPPRAPRASGLRRGHDERLRGHARDSVANCGACGRAASPTPRRPARAASAAWAPTRRASPTATPSPGGETSLSTTANCGRCGAACAFANAAAICAGGACARGACSAGFGDCNASPADGCETPLTTTSNCGACGAAPRGLPRDRGVYRRRVQATSATRATASTTGGNC
ncbi:MAG: hypothetical protein U0326_21840 [Polyangiales bacterium]